MNPTPGNAMTSQQLSQLPQQQQQQLANTTQINRFMSVNGTTLDTSPPARRGGVLPIGNLLVAKAGAQIQVELSPILFSPTMPMIVRFNVTDVCLRSRS